MTREARLALRALHDLGAVAARWDHPAYKELAQRRFAIPSHRRGDPLPIYRLTLAGRKRAELIFFSRSH